MVKRVATIPKKPTTVDEYKKALSKANREVVSLKRQLAALRKDFAFLEKLAHKQSEDIFELENRSWFSRLFNLKG